MPLYQYKCTRCDRRVEILHKMAETPSAEDFKCIEGTCELVKELSPVAGIVKGQNPYSKASSLLGLDQRPEKSSKSPASDASAAHQCGSGCALHSR